MSLSASHRSLKDHYALQAVNAQDSAEDGHAVEEFKCEELNTLVAFRALEIKFQIHRYAGRSSYRRANSYDSNEENVSLLQLVTTPLDDILQFSENLSSSLLKMDSDRVQDALKMFEYICVYMGLRKRDSEHEHRRDIISTLVELCVEHSELKDELHMQLLKQSRNLHEVSLQCRVWELWLVVGTMFAPSKEFVTLILDHVNWTLRAREGHRALANLVDRTWKTIKKTVILGPRSTTLSAEEIEAFLGNTQMKTRVKFMNGIEHCLSYYVTTTVQEAVEIVASNIKLTDRSTFALYELDVQETETEPATSYHKRLEDHLYLSDVLSKSHCEDDARLVFKRWTYREQDSEIADPVFLALAYAQAQHEFLEGNYPLARKEVAEMTALQILVAEGPRLRRSERRFTDAAQKFTNSLDLMSRRRLVWYQNVYSRYKSFSNLSAEEGKARFLTIVQRLPYGNSAFFAASVVSDPIGLLPSKTLIGINERGVHLFRPVPKEYLYSSELKDIAQFCFLDENIFCITIKSAGVVNEFRFETKQGRELCALLEMHMRDIMIKRFINEQRKADCENRPVGDGLPVADFGAYYQQHVDRMHLRQAECESSIAELMRRHKDIQTETEKARFDLHQTQQALLTADAEKNNIYEDMGAIRGEMLSFDRELTDLRHSLHRIERDTLMQTLRTEKGPASARAEHLAERLMRTRQTVSSEIERESELQRHLEEFYLSRKANRNRLERPSSSSGVTAQSSQSRSGELRSARSLSRPGEVQLSDLVERVASVDAMYKDSIAQTTRVHLERAELRDLLDLRANKDRRTEVFAQTIESQTNRIEHLCTEYKKQQDMRKRYLQQFEDLQGKVRIYALLHPLSSSDQRSTSVSCSDGRTIRHRCPYRRKREEYSFDNVFTPETTQEEVLESVNHLVQSAVDGSKASVVVHGQRGLDTAATSSGSVPDVALTSKAVSCLFDAVQRNSSKFIFSIGCCMLELRGNTLTDLLRPESDKTAHRLKIRRDAEGMVHVQGAAVQEVMTAEQLQRVIAAGQKRWHSSTGQRKEPLQCSHLIMSLFIKCTNVTTRETTNGKLSIVELAASRKFGRSGKESKATRCISTSNRSLLALKRVISAVSQGKQHIPYRDDKLTFLLSDSIGGLAKTTLFVNIAPGTSSSLETRESLSFATTVRRSKKSKSQMLLKRNQRQLEKQLLRWKRGVDLTGVMAEYRGET